MCACACVFGLVCVSLGWCVCLAVCGETMEDREQGEERERDDKEWGREQGSGPT